MKPSLEDMQMFLTVVEARTFTAAAHRLGRTKSAVSQAITRLEGDLGARLLYRTTRSLSLTEVGTRFFAHCGDIRTSYEAALNDLKTDSDSPSGTLSITAPHALCLPVIVPAIARLVELHPNINVRLLADDSPVDLVESKIDLAVRVGTPQMQSAKIAKLGTLYESLYASPDYVASRGGMPNNLTDTVEWDHIANDWQGVPVKYQSADGSIIRVNPKIRCNALHDTLRLAEMGAGLAWLPNIAARESIDKKTLVRLFEVGASPVHYMHLFSHNPPLKVQTFVQLIRKQLQSDQTLTG